MEPPHLTRKDMLGETGQWELIQEHQKRCDYLVMKNLAEKMKNENDADAAEKLVEMLAFDKSVRETAIEKGKMDPELMDFLFGRPMTLSLSIFKLKIETGTDGRQILKT
jgi:hypothetical protein